MMIGIVAELSRDLIVRCIVSVQSEHVLRKLSLLWGTVPLLVSSRSRSKKDRFCRGVHE